MKQRSSDKLQQYLESGRRWSKKSCSDGHVIIRNGEERSLRKKNSPMVVQRQPANKK